MKLVAFARPFRKMRFLKTSHPAPHKAGDFNNKMFSLSFWFFLAPASPSSSHAVCNQFSRGVFSILGAVSPDSFDTLHSYSNTFQMPFITPWFPEKVSTRYTIQLLTATDDPEHSFHVIKVVEPTQAVAGSSLDVCSAIYELKLYMPFRITMNGLC